MHCSLQVVGGEEDPAFPRSEGFEDLFFSPQAGKARKKTRLSEVQFRAAEWLPVVSKSHDVSSGKDQQGINAGSPAW